MPANHPIRDFTPASPEMAATLAEITRQRSSLSKITPIIGGERIGGGCTTPIVEPHATQRVLGEFSSAQPGLAQHAVAAAMAARGQWAATSLQERSEILLRAADLIETKYNYRLLAATMLGQSKTVYQAEIDAICELVDFIRFNTAFARDMAAWQPLSTSAEANSLDYRPLDGFVFAASPFNFTAIAGNLVLAPLLMGNPVVWLPSERSVYSNAILMEIFEEAGVPPGVINFCPTTNPAEFGAQILGHADLAAVHFTGGSATFDHIWRTVGTQINGYKSYPRLVGETGGKDFVLAHSSADPDVLHAALIRGAFDYQGQKCSAASRAYIPRSIFADTVDRLAVAADSLPMGDVADPKNFLGAVIDRRAFDTISGHLARAQSRDVCHQITDRHPNSDNGWFVPPTVVICDDPKDPLMTQEVFGPVLALYCYEDARLDDVCQLIDQSTPYALTGAFVAQNEAVVANVLHKLRGAAGNFYINDKPTGAVVGRQPFGGSRRSGTNDKAGSPYNLLRWTSPRTIKRNLSPAIATSYPHMLDG